MNIHQILLFAFGILELILAVVILVRYQKTPSIQALSGILYSFIAMTFLLVAMMNTDNATTRLVLARLSFLAGCFGFVNTLKLAIYYPIHSLVSQRNANLLYWIPIIVFIPIIFITSKFVSAIDLVNQVPQPITGYLFPIFVIFAAFYLVTAVIIMGKKLRMVSGEQHKQAVTFVALLILAGIIGLVANFILPMLNITSNTIIGMEAGGVMLMFVASVVIKK